MRAPCIHFNGIQNDCCKAGVSYRDLAGPEPGVWLRLPCNTKAADPVACSARVEETLEQRAEDEAEYLADLAKLKLAIAKAREWRVEPRPSQNRSEVVVCPCCDGRLRLSQSAYNGHVHGRCETEGCVSWME